MAGSDLRLELHASLRGTPEVRAALAPWLREHHICHEVSNEVTLVCTELFVNAVEAAGPDGSVVLVVAHEPGQIAVEVADDGPGFAPEIFEALGEPYITSRPGHHALGETDIGPQGALDEHEGMGLGFCISKNPLEQTGGWGNAENPSRGGAQVSIRWPPGG